MECVINNESLTAVFTVLHILHITVPAAATTTIRFCLAHSRLRSVSIGLLKKNLQELLVQDCFKARGPSRHPTNSVKAPQVTS